MNMKFDVNNSNEIFQSKTIYNNHMVQFLMILICERIFFKL